MKTSNKVLLILGLTLLLSPFLLLSIYIKAHYETQAVNGDRTIDAKSAGMVAIPTNAFNNIVVKDKKLNAWFTYELVPSDHFGVKIPEALQDITSAKVNSNGELEIFTNYQFKHHPYANIVIYTPKNTGIYFNNLKDMTSIYTGTDSLYLSAINCKSNINVRGSLDNVNTQNLNVMAENSSVTVVFKQLKNLTLSGKGNADININEYEDSMKVNKLELNLQDKSILSASNIMANSIVGFVAETAKLTGLDRNVIKKS